MTKARVRPLLIQLLTLEQFPSLATSRAWKILHRRTINLLILMTFNIVNEPKNATRGKQFEKNCQVKSLRFLAHSLC